jgi:hypothetical protein
VPRPPRREDAGHQRREGSVIRAIGHGAGAQPLVLLGLEPENLRRLAAGEPIAISGRRFTPEEGIPVDIIIAYGTPDNLVASLRQAGMVDEDSHVHVPQGAGERAPEGELPADERDALAAWIEARVPTAEQRTALRDMHGTDTSWMVALLDELTGRPVKAPEGVVSAARVLLDRLAAWERSLGPANDEPDDDEIAF